MYLHNVVYPTLTLCLLYLLYVSYTYCMSPILTLYLLYLLYVSYTYCMSPILTLCLLCLLYVSYTYFMSTYVMSPIFKATPPTPQPPIRLLFLYMQHYRAYLKSWGRSAQPHEPHGRSAQPRNCLKQT